MYVPEFVMGAICTIAFEAVALVIVAICLNKSKDKDDKEDN